MVLREKKNNKINERAGGEGGGEVRRHDTPELKNEMEERHNVILERNRVQHNYIHKSN